MNDQLEDRLRHHYRIAADELHLAAVTWEDVLGRRRLGQRAARPRLASIAAAAALVASLAGGAIALRSRGGAPDQASVVTAGREGKCPAEIPDGIYPNDVRLVGAVLPQATPLGYCVVDHQVLTLNTDTQPYVVWTSCDRCDEPAAAIARTVPGAHSERESAAPAQTVDVGGRPGRYYDPDEKEAVARLFTNDVDGNEMLLVGWGLDRDEMVAAAVSVAGDLDADVPSMTRIYDGPLPDYQPASLPSIGNLGIGYQSADGSTGPIGFQLYQGAYIPSPDAFLWLNPGSRVVEIGGRRTVLLPPTWEGGGTTWSAAISQVDDQQLVIWMRHDLEPTDADDLAAIELTTAEPDDPRWIEIAYESGGYDAQG